MKILSKKEVSILTKMLIYFYQEIFYEYKNLNKVEKKLFTKEEFELILDKFNLK
mgnify:CR=1 FL=1